MEALDIMEHLHFSLNAKICNNVHEGVSAFWSIPPLVEEHAPWLVEDIQSLTLPLIPKNDWFVWKHSKDGYLTVREV
jgi:hypothetical protein